MAPRGPGRGASKNMVVVMSFDGGYAEAGAVAIASLSAHSPPGGGLEIWLLTANLTREQEALLARAAENVRLHQHRLTPAELSLPVRSDYVTAATFGRLYVAKIVPRSYSRALYLDADILVTGDVRDLWHLDLEGCVLAAAVEQTAPTLGSERGLEHVQELGLDRDLPYFNAGVLLVDLDQWRKHDVGNRALDHVRRFSPPLMDQSALNAVVARQWLELEPIWNLTEYWFRSEKKQARFADVLARARIVHYVGRKKPWLREDRWLGDRWLAYRDELRS